MFAVSWLSGTALQWYEPNLELEDYDLPDFALDWEVFAETLKTAFGEPDPAATAAHKLGNLTMRDSHHVTRYDIDFNKYAVLTGFDERALSTMYYKGLAPRIKDGLVYSGRPRTHRDLQAQAQNLDLRYRERRDEDRAYDKSTPVLHTRPSASTSTSLSSPQPSTSQPKTPTRGATPATPRKPDLTKTLGSDGQLLPAVKKCGKDNSLCMICGSDKHFAEDCPSRKPQSRATIVDGQLVSDEEPEDSPN